MIWSSIIIFAHITLCSAGDSFNEEIKDENNLKLSKKYTFPQKKRGSNYKSKVDSSRNEANVDSPRKNSGCFYELGEFTPKNLYKLFTELHPNIQWKSIEWKDLFEKSPFNNLLTMINMNDVTIKIAKYDAPHEKSYFLLSPLPDNQKGPSFLGHAQSIENFAEVLENCQKAYFYAQEVSISRRKK
jgi:hypothetical protein